MSAHRLAVEVGRWHTPTKIPYNERKCQVCNTLEDEFNSLLECPLYNDLRQSLTPSSLQSNIKLMINGYHN